MSRKLHPEDGNRKILKLQILNPFYWIPLSGLWKAFIHENNRFKSVGNGSGKILC